MLLNNSNTTILRTRILCTNLVHLPLLLAPAFHFPATIKLSHCLLFIRENAVICCAGDYLPPHHLIPLLLPSVSAPNHASYPSVPTWYLSFPQSLPPIILPSPLYPSLHFYCTKMILLNPGFTRHFGPDFDFYPIHFGNINVICCWCELLWCDPETNLQEVLDASLDTPSIFVTVIFSLMFTFPLG